VLYSKRRVSSEKISSFVFLLRGDITMAAKKKAKEGQSKSEQSARNKKTPMKKATKKKIALRGQISKKRPASKAAHKKAAGKKKIALKGTISTKKPATKTAHKKVAGKKKIALKVAISKKKSASKAAYKKVAGKKSKMTRKSIRETGQPAEKVGFSSRGPTANEGGQSGDLQGLSNLEGADSESVVELLEEGNAFEAAVVAGVENAGNEPSEVRTQEVLEDDVPREYLDRD
jgi:hypothetical protein